MEEDNSNKLKVNLDYKVPEGQKAGAELTDNYITMAVTNAHERGLEGQQRRIFGRIQRKLEIAIANGSESIELEQAEKDFLRKAFDSCKVPAHQSKWFVVLEDEIERATARK